jgi:CRISPR-associated endonuclease/helicase Cas3
MSPTHLLAKSCDDSERPPTEATLRGHTMLVCEAADLLLYSRGAASLQAAGLEATWQNRLARIVRLAAFIHDLGKCSDHFQAMIRHDRAAPQLVRHEALSLWLVWPGQILSDWLQSAVGGNEDLMIAAVAAAGHHRKFWRNAIAAVDAGAGVSLQLYTDHDEFMQLVAAGARRLGLVDAQPLPRMHVHVGRRASLVNDFERWESEWQEYARRRPREARLAAVAKALVLAADVAGSALPKTNERLSWITAQLGRRATAAALRAVVDRRLSGKPSRPFQNEVAASSAPVTFVRAGCGSGKTVAAYLWAACQHAGRQLWITYPTTGTTTEGFRDYVADVDVTARLEHGRREIDLEIFDLRDDADDGRQRDRLDAIRGWGAEVITSTVDTVLGLVQNHRKGLYAWPGLAHAAVVFDEIHAYDESLFGSLLRFLEAMPGTPALLMTASLPADRMTALRELTEHVHGVSLVEVNGPPQLESLPRYFRLDADPIAAARECVRAGGRVLWVSNTVDRSIEAAKHFVGALVYHSRFRYVDRVERHDAVINAFDAAGPCVVSTTQVAEMSLDISADLLITDLAPIPSLIQRLGRLNRRATPEAPGVPKPYVVVQTTNALPYSIEALTEASAWLTTLGAGPHSQNDLVRTWTTGAHQIPVRVTSAWLDGGFSTVPAGLREATPGIAVLREKDAQEARARPGRASALAIPMNPPKGDSWRGWVHVAYLPVAPDAALSYDPQRGGSWK